MTLCDVRRLKICCFHYGGKSKNIHIQYITINAKNWLIAYNLPTNTKKCLGCFRKNAIVTSFPVTEGIPFFVNICIM